MLVLNQKRGHWSVLRASCRARYVMALGRRAGYTLQLIVLDGELAVP